MGGEIAAVYGEFIRSARLDELVDTGQKEGLQGYLTLMAADYARATQQRVEAVRAVLGLFDRFDALVTPTLSVPMGFGPAGLPLGLSITGNLFAENTILQIGITYQGVTDWHRRKPPT